MSKCWLAIHTLVIALGLGVPALQADEGHHGNGHHGNKHSQEDREGDREDGDREDGDNHHQGRGWERRGGYEYRTYGDRDGRPAGWSQGRKTGWGNCGLPPGQAKKYGCRTYSYQGVPHFYYQDDRGAIIIRRPRIELHGSIDIVP